MNLLPSSLSYVLSGAFPLRRLGLGQESREFLNRGFGRELTDDFAVSPKSIRPDNQDSTGVLNPAKHGELSGRSGLGIYGSSLDFLVPDQSL